MLTAALEEIYRSNSWKLLGLLRWCGLQTRRAGTYWRGLSTTVAQAGGWGELPQRILKAWRQDGIAGVGALVRRHVPLTAPGASRAPETISGPANIFRAPASGKPEILFISHDASRTGAPIFLLDLIASLAQRLDVASTILLASGGELEREFRKLGTTIVLGNRNELDPLVLKELQQRDIRLVYANTITNGTLQVRLKALGCPIVCHVHELAYSIENFFGAHNLQQILASTDFFLAGSKAVAGYLEKLVPRERVALAYPFIDMQANLQAAAHAQPPLDLPPGTVVVGACGTIVWRKGTDLFVQLARRVIAATGKPVVFVWLGGPLDQVEYHNLHHDAQVLGIAERLVFPGPVSAHLQYFMQFDIFVLPSREDPFPLVMLDAASLGKPLVCFENSGGAREFVETDAGFVVPYLDVDAMAAAVLRLVESPELRTTLGEGARRKVLERHDLAVGSEPIARIIRGLLGGARKQA